MPESLSLGKAGVRKDARAKVTGAAEYAADIRLDDTLSAAVVRSSVHYGRILAIDTSAAVKASGVIRVLTAADIPGEQAFGALVQDQPALASELVHHYGQPVALVIATSRAAAAQAARLVQVRYEPRDAVFDLES